MPDFIAADANPAFITKPTKHEQELINDTKTALMFRLLELLGGEIKFPHTHLAPPSGGAALEIVSADEEGYFIIRIVAASSENPTE